MIRIFDQASRKIISNYGSNAEGAFRHPERDVIAQTDGRREKAKDSGLRKIFVKSSVYDDARTTITVSRMRSLRL